MRKQTYQFHYSGNAFKTHWSIDFYTGQKDFYKK